MFRNVASKAGLVGFALLVGAAGLQACSSSDNNGGSTTVGGSTSHGGTGGATSTGGATATGGTSPGAGTTSTGGTSSGAGATSTGGTGGATAGGPFACPSNMATCNSWTTFAQSATNSWGNGTFTGGITTFPATFTRDPAVTNAFHMTGMVTGYGFGFGLYFTKCSDLSKYTGVSFKVKAGNATTTSIMLQVQINPDYPFVQAPADGKGACVATDLTNPFGTCIAPSMSVPVTTTESTMTVTFAMLAGGMPVATADATQVTGIQWALPWMPPATAYAADITLSDVTLTGGTGAAVSCATATGAGGAGGTGGASSGGGGTGGAAAGSGGVGGGG